MADLNNDIEKYLKGELSPAERNRLEKLALDDPFLAEALEGAEEINAEDFKEDLNQIHSKLDDLLSENKKNKSGWFWPMRIAAGVVLLICSTYLVYFLIDNNETTNELALNKTEDTTPVEKEMQPIVSDSIVPVEPKEEKPAVVVPSTSEKKNDLLDLRSTPADEKDTAKPPITEDEAIEPIAQAEVAEEITLKEIPVEVAPAKSEARVTEAESNSRAKKSAVPQAAPSREVSGYAADKTAKRTITGKVVDVEDGTPLPGVNVLVKGTTTGTMTDLDGNYQIQIEDTDHALVFSFIGLETKEEKIDGSQINVQMDQDLSELSEVVVTGYGYENNDIFTNTLSDYVQAEPEGGFKAYKIYLEDNLHYPIQAIENKVQGKVTVRFEISPTGTLSDFQITKGIGFGCDEEAIRLIRQGPKWSSPKRGDVNVKGRVKVRMKFTLPK